MKRIALLFALAGTLAAAQTTTTPAPTAPKSNTTAAKPAVTAKSATAVKPTVRTGTRAGVASGIKLPAGVPAHKGLVKTAFTLKYQDFQIGTGALAEPNKLYKVHYTGWLASDGRKFDSSYDHPGAPVLDKDGKPEKDADGKPKLGDPQPFSFPQGFGRLIAGWDQGFEGMKIGGKRRLFIPWQLAYGVRGVPARDVDHPGIPPSSDLIFDVELVDVTDLPARPPQGGPPGRPMPVRPGSTPGAASAPPAGTAPVAPGTAPKPAAPASPTAVPAPATPAPSTTSQPAPPK